jgi:hypothetical protein
MFALTGIWALCGGHVTLGSIKDAKAGPHQVTVRDAKGKQATLNVSVKQ